MCDSHIKERVSNLRRYKLFNKINVFDIVVVLILVAGIYGAYIFSAPPQQVIAESGSQINFVLELRERPVGFYSTIEPGALVIDSTRGSAIGTVVSTHALPFLLDAPHQATNTIHRRPVEGLEFTYVVVEAFANVSDFEIAVNNVRIMVNSSIYVRSRDFAGVAWITGLEILN